MENKKVKYYVEISNATRESGEYPYLIQTKWYDTIKECYDFITDLDYFDNDLVFSIMYATFNEDGSYNDIECLERDIKINKNKGE